MSGPIYIPINFNSSSILSGTDDYRLSLHYSNEFYTLATNDGTSMKFTLETDSSGGYIKFRGVQYKLVSMTYLSGSIHKWDGEKMDGEVIIEHTLGSGSGSKTVYLCIPVTTVHYGGSKLSELIISGLNSGTNYLDRGISMASFIRPGQFMHYNDTSWDDTNDTTFDKTYIVFENPIYIYKVLDTNLKLTTYTPHTISSSNFYINTGGVQTDTPNEVYINCTPTGSSGSTPVTKERINIPLSKKTTDNIIRVTYIIGVIIIGIVVLRFVGPFIYRHVRTWGGEIFQWKNNRIMTAIRGDPEPPSSEDIELGSMTSS
jgi:hypothetical protein